MRRNERLLVAIASACAVAVIAYAMMRIIERVFFPEPNPALVTWSVRSGFVWRSLLAIYAGGMEGFGGYALAVHAPQASVECLSRLVTGAVIALALQGILLP